VGIDDSSAEDRPDFAIAAIDPVGADLHADPPAAVGM
jgi:hypothetical protein